MKAYLDNSATTRPTQGVIRAMTECMEEGWHNPSSVYGPAVAAFRQVRACREAILEKLGAPGEKLIFTSGGTEANNLAILGAVERMRGKQLVAVNARSTPRCWPPSSACAQWATRCACFPWTARARLTTRRFKKP